MVDSPRMMLVDPCSGLKDLEVTECQKRVVKVAEGARKMLVDLDSH